MMAMEWWETCSTSETLDLEEAMHFVPLLLLSNCSSPPFLYLNQQLLRNKKAKVSKPNSVIWSRWEQITPKIKKWKKKSKSKSKGKAKHFSLTTAHCMLMKRKKLRNEKANLVTEKSGCDIYIYISTTGIRYPVLPHHWLRTTVHV